MATLAVGKMYQFVLYVFYLGVNVSDTVIMNFDYTPFDYLARIPLRSRLPIYVMGTYLLWILP